MGQKLLFLTKQVEIRDGIWYVEYKEHKFDSRFLRRKESSAELERLV